MNYYFTSQENIRRIDSFRLIYLAQFIISFLTTEFGRFVYRPYVYSHQIDDFGLADTIGNLGGIVTQIFFMLAVLNPPKAKLHRTIIFLVIGYILYEFSQTILPKGVFDWNDIYATILGGLISTFILFIINIYFKNNRIFYQF